ncbi:penicillin acylase family protein [Mucilaginibacter koreensis]
MKRFLLGFALCLPLFTSAQKFTASEIKRYEQQARKVNIIRDQWGVPHIYSKTDANAVFGLMYSQCEENFKGIELNYLYQLGKQAEAGIKNTLYTDIQLQLIADSTDAIREYKRSPVWFKKLLDAYADGINYYLYKHPETKPMVLTRFEPWYALMFTDGSVAATSTGGIALSETEKFYNNGELMQIGALAHPLLSLEEQVNAREVGSNGFAISPSKSKSGHAMLYINPHVPFYFRSEVQMVSDEGLNVYGAVTWGQFFVYQGFNQHCGWMHTSSNADVADLYAEKVSQKNGKWYYEYDGQLKPVKTRQLKFYVRQEKDQIVEIQKTGYYTHHGPILGSRNGKWLALKHNNRSYNALLESWLITKANNLAEYKKAMNLLQNTTNNTVYADDKGNTILWYGNFMPKRDPALDWTQPVDGSMSKTEWQGLHPLKEIVQVVNPQTGWIQNCNSTPFTASGSSSPLSKKYPAYMAPDGQNYRGVRAVQLFSSTGKLSLDQLISTGYDHYLTAFDAVLPPLFRAYTSAADSLKQKLKPAIDTLQRWSRYSSANSIATTLANEYGTLVFSLLPRPASSEAGTYQTQRVETLLANLSQAQQLTLFTTALNQLAQKYGSWQIKWGDVNRYQRLADGTFDDNKASLPAGAVASTFGQLPSFVSRSQNTVKRYGYSGNSFIAAVEFGPKIKAKSIITGGQSFNGDSLHFTDQAQRYLNGDFKEVLFYKTDVLKHQTMSYRPGESHPAI